MRVRTRVRRRGFSLVEAMVSAAVLGIALVGLVEMHTTSIRGTAKAEDIGRATEIARQLADRVASQPIDQLPACGSTTAPLGAVTGCRLRSGLNDEPSRLFANIKTGVDCTRLVQEDAVTSALNGDIDTVTAGSPESLGAYRIDTWLSSHPNNAPGTAQVHVWVCWRDASGMVNEIQTIRVKIAGVW